MKTEAHLDTPLKLYGIDNILAVMKKRKISQKQILKWNQQSLNPMIVQSRKDYNYHFAKQQIQAVLTRPTVENDRTLLITDDPKMIFGLKREKLAMILGLVESGNDQIALYESGADRVISSLKEVEIVEGNSSITSFSQSLPSAFYELSKIHLTQTQNRPLFLFDYDGTLSPITTDPAKAYIPEQTRSLLEQLANRFRVAIVSGRDMNDLKNFIALDNLIYAGSHGFRISGPQGMEKEHEQTSQLLPQFDRIEREIKKIPELQIKGIQIERKYLAIAVHYRNAPPGSYMQISKAIKRLLSDQKQFKTGRGKKVIEIRPALNWHKGRAVEWIIKELESKHSESYLPLYMGDDITDEDAFIALANHGVGILVGEHTEPTAAKCSLRDVTEVQKLLHFLVHTW